jgi:hypothetical protein
MLKKIFLITDILRKINKKTDIWYTSKDVAASPCNAACHFLKTCSRIAKETLCGPTFTTNKEVCNTMTIFIVYFLISNNLGNRTK